MPHVPLKVLRGGQEEEDIQDKYFDNFKAPGTTTEDAEDDNDIDDESRTSSLSIDDVNTDICETGEQGRERYLGGDTNSVDTVIQFDNEIQNHQDKNSQQNPDYNAGESANLGAVDVEAVAQVHHLSISRDDTENDSLSNDDTAPLLTNRH